MRSTEAVVNDLRWLASRALTMSRQPPALGPSRDPNPVVLFEDIQRVAGELRGSRAENAVLRAVAAAATACVETSKVHMWSDAETLLLLAADSLKE